jgi:CheY-like chemotaxis protein
MRGNISLESRHGSGTTATFSIPFNKSQFIGTSTPLVDLGPVPDRLQSELSLSCDSSSQNCNFVTGASSPFHSPKRKPIPIANAGKDFTALPSNTGPKGVGAAPSHHHILIVEDNPINQQIALRTIKTLGYSVSAVWNGQEALQYLLEATQNTTFPGAHRPVDRYILPSLILMDVQMPVLDGYRATHTLRHHAPYKSMALINRIPVVALTASAIQGDREKCQRAGMNDYLAKPVKRITLEKMIRKWTSSESTLVVRSRSIDIKDEDSSRPDIYCRDDSSNCPGPDYQIAEAQSDANSTTLRRVSNSQPLLHSVSMSRQENASDRGRRLAEAAEMASTLRDAKLIAATGTDGHGAVSSTGSLGSAGRPTVVGNNVHEAYPDQRGHGHALTEENIEKLNADSANDNKASLQAKPTAI